MWPFFEEKNERTIDSLASHPHSNERRNFVYTEIPTHTQICTTQITCLHTIVSYQLKHQQKPV